MFDAGASPCDTGSAGSTGSTGGQADGAAGQADGAAGRAAGADETSGPRSLGDVARALAPLAGLDVTAVSDGELTAAVALVERARRSLDALGCHLVGELDVRKVTDLEHGMRTKGWLARETQAPGHVAGRVVRLGGALRRLPAVDAAFTAGTIGIEHVAVLERVANVRIADAIDAAVPALIADLGRTRFETWKREVEAFAQLIDLDGAPPDPRPSTFSARRVGGEVVLKGHLSGLEGEALAQAIDALTDELHRRAVTDADQGAPTDLTVPSRAELAAQALLELVRRGVAAGRTGSAPATELTLALHAHPTDPVALTRPDGDGAVHFVLPDGTVLGHDATSHDGCCGDGSADRHGFEDDDRVRWSDTIELRAPSGVVYRVARHHVLVCDPLLAPVVLDGLGVPLDAGRTQRYATREQRRALAVRDGGCTFPGCDAPVAWCDAHHVVAWEHHGETDLPNLALLCRHHHGVTHRRGWTMTATPDQWFTWTTPSGATLHSQRHGHTRAGPAPPDAA